MGSELNLSIPVILLKNASNGHTDPYTSHLLSNPSSLNCTFQPIYVPVLEHTSYTKPILSIFYLFHENQNIEDARASFPYGGLIFTSQRAVEAFVSALSYIASSVETSSTGEEKLILQCLKHLAIPLYAVGPATALSLKEVREEYLPASWIQGGKDAGTGERLAEVILHDYNASHEGSPANETAGKGSSKEKKPLLFLTGAKHRDIIPVKLTSAPPEQRIHVEEKIVYASAESQSFHSDIASAMNTTDTAPIRWVVVFSPTGGQTLLRALGWLDHMTTKIHGPDDSCWADRKTFVASIGPTTRDYMRKTYGFEVDVCSEKPSPEGVRQGIQYFMQRHGWLP
ncbi:MAG: hypothetical protein LQ338_000377 [Usnochroma carphineum]|nr:MAG: hypothetical protein LQ338_000377 [Usnochroma carphineum]